MAHAAAKLSELLNCASTLSNLVLLIDNRSENLQHCQWGALPRSLSAAELRLGKISGIWQR